MCVRRILKGELARCTRDDDSVSCADFVEGRVWHERFFRWSPDFVPHEDFAEWEMFRGCRQVAKGEPAVDSGPLRLGVRDIETRN